MALEANLTKIERHNWHEIFQGSDNKDMMNSLQEKNSLNEISYREPLSLKTAKALNNHQIKECKEPKSKVSTEIADLSCTKPLRIFSDLGEFPLNCKKQRIDSFQNIPAIDFNAERIEKSVGLQSIIGNLSQEIDKERSRLLGLVQAKENDIVKLKKDVVEKRNDLEKRIENLVKSLELVGKDCEYFREFRDKQKKSFEELRSEYKQLSESVDEISKVVSNQLLKQKQLSRQNDDFSKQLSQIKFEITNHSKLKQESDSKIDKAKFRIKELEQSLENEQNRYKTLLFRHEGNVTETLETCIRKAAIKFEKIKEESQITFDLQSDKLEEVHLLIEKLSPVVSKFAENQPYEACNNLTRSFDIFKRNLPDIIRDSCTEVFDSTIKTIEQICLNESSTFERKQTQVSKALTDLHVMISSRIDNKDQLETENKKLKEQLQLTERKLKVQKSTTTGLHNYEENLQVLAKEKCRLEKLLIGKDNEIQSLKEKCADVSTLASPNSRSLLEDQELQFSRLLEEKEARHSNEVKMLKLNNSKLQEEISSLQKSYRDTDSSKKDRMILEQENEDLKKNLLLREKELARIAKNNARMKNTRNLLSSPSTTAIETPKSLPSAPSIILSPSGADEFETVFKTPTSVEKTERGTPGMSKTLKTVTQRYHEYFSDEQKKQSKQLTYGSRRTSSKRAKG